MAEKSSELEFSKSADKNSESENLINNSATDFENKNDDSFMDETQQIRGQIVETRQQMG